MYLTGGKQRLRRVKGIVWEIEVYIENISY